MKCVESFSVLVDRGPWYPEALRSLGLKWKHGASGMRNRIERWFGILKAGTERFSSDFLNNSTIKSARIFLETFVAWYNALPKIKS